jgi:hypothetical protein
MANDETTVESSRALASRIRKHSSDDEERLLYAYVLCLARSPEPFEAKRLVKYLDQQRTNFATAPEDASKVTGEAVSETVADAAAWTSLARALMNLDEFITRE